MGCDGGTIPRRDELVKVKKKPEEKDKDSELAFKWLYCSVSQQLLRAPVVMCGLGRLYNKMSLIEGLLNRSSLPDTANHIKSLKDVKDLNLTANPDFKPDDEKKEGGLDERACPYICPITGLEMSGKFRFVGLWSCGCVMSERIFKEINGQLCVNCHAVFSEEDIVVLNARDEDLELMTSRMESRQARLKKKKDKRIKCKAEPATPSVAEVEAAAEVEENTPIERNATEEETKVPQAAQKNSPVKRLGALVKSQNDTKKIKVDYSVAKDPQVSDVYKSLFTTHKSEKEQNRAHWVTYNPFYN